MSDEIAALVQDFMLLIREPVLRCSSAASETLERP
jgi:hypothetical protein